ncbi:MAG: HesA/MoeB/ThiF family protein [Oscillospiraceae bacterium]|nr:HesA/MoeB/ThiF family protein [Oscillospiraceae bacterium]
MDGRFSRQIAFPGIGENGQRKLSSSRIAIVGLGALGTVAADRLCRAGVGFLRLIDHDTVELSNLQRQLLFTEEDVGKSKVKASAARLFEINSGSTTEPVTRRLTDSGDPAIRDVDVVLDCTDNAEARYLINEGCVRSGTPWVHGAAAGSFGRVFAIVPNGACFSCLHPRAEDTSGDTAATLGMLNTTTAAVGALEANETLKILVNAPLSGLMMFDLWSGAFEYVGVVRDPDCPVCGGRDRR